MNYKNIPGIDMAASSLVFGCAGDLMQEGGDNSYMLDAALDKGINFFDTARCYGDSEYSLGAWMKERGNRHNVIVLTKGCHPKKESLAVHRVNAKAIIEDVETSLSALSTDYIDIYLLHRDDVTVPVSEIIEELSAQQKKGNIISYGVSNWTLSRIQEANSYAKEKGLDGFVVNSPNYSLATQVDDPWQSGSEAISISGEAGAESREYFYQNNMPIVAYSSLGRGLFSGKFKADEAEKAGEAMDQYAMRGYFSLENIEKLRRAEKMAKFKNATVSQVALSYLLSQKLQVHPVVSFSKPEHMLDNLKALELTLDEEDLAYLDGKRV